MTDDIDIFRHPAANRIKLAFDPATGRFRLTVPKRASLAKARAWVAENIQWMAEQRAQLPQARPFVPGAELPFGDETLVIDWQEGPSRLIRRIDNRLVASGAEATLPRRVEAWLRREALRLLEEDTAFYAGRAGVNITRVAIGDPRGRWGSCSSSGTIRYSWRLVMAPTAVRRATAAHEVAHRIHMNHSAAFHTLVETLYGSDPTPHRHWLRTNGAALHWYGRSSTGGAG